jgi:hypothetical protein
LPCIDGHVTAVGWRFATGSAHGRGRSGLRACLRAGPVSRRSCRNCQRLPEQRTHGTLYVSVES